MFFLTYLLRHAIFCLQAKNSSGVIGFIPENYIVIIDENAVDSGHPADSQSIEGDNQTSFEEPDVSSPPPVKTPTPVLSPTSPPAVTVTSDQDDFPPPPPITPPSDSAQEVTSYSSGDTEVQQVTDSMENMTLPVGG